MTANTDINPESVTSERAITPAFIVYGYIVRSLEDPISQLTFGDVVQVSFMANEDEYGYVEIRRLLLVLTVEQNEFGNFKGLVLPCGRGWGAPAAYSCMILPNRCAEKIDTGEKAIEIMNHLWERGDCDSFDFRQYYIDRYDDDQDVPF